MFAWLFPSKTSVSPKYVIMRNDESELTLGVDLRLPGTYLRQLLDERLSDLSENDQFIHANGAPIHILDEPDTLINELLCKNSNVIHLKTRSKQAPENKQPITPSVTANSLTIVSTTKPSDTIILIKENVKKSVPISEILSERTVTINANELSQRDMQRLVLALRQNRHVKELTIASNCSHVMKILIDVLAVNQTIKRLKMSDMSNSMNDAHCTLIANALASNRHIQDLDLGSNSITSKGCQAIGNMLKSNQTLRSLRICRNRLGNQGIKFICEAMVVNTTLERLDIYQTHMSISGLVPIIQMLRVNQSLTWLDIGDNNLGDDGIIKIADALRENNTLLELCTKWNKITKKGVLALADMLQINSTLKTIKLHFNNLSEQEKADMHQQTPQLKTTGLDICSIM